MHRLARLVVLGLIVWSVLLGGLAFGAQTTSVSVFGPGKSGPTKPGKGCGDKNHYHERESECKKPPR